MQLPKTTLMKSVFGFAVSAKEIRYWDEFEVNYALCISPDLTTLKYAQMTMVGKLFKNAQRGRFLTSLSS